MKLHLVADLSDKDAQALRSAVGPSVQRSVIRQLVEDDRITFTLHSSGPSDSGNAPQPGSTELLAVDDLDEAVWGPAPTATEALEAVVGSLHTQYAARQALVDSGLTCKQAASLLGVREQAITAKIDEGKLIGIKSGREWRLPAWQFVPDNAAGIVPALDTLQRAFPGGPVALSAWMTTPSAEFDGRTPLQEVLAHGPEHVIDHAARLTSAAW